jgi:hypothetical protein
MALSIGAVVPNFDYARYLPERLASIRDQQRPVQALVFLDDASQDDSWRIAEPLLAAFRCPVIRHRNAINSGSVLRQWRDGVARLDTDLAWIAEADDRAAPALTEALAARLEADPEAVFAFCDSAGIDAEGVLGEADAQAYYGGLGDNPLAADAVFEVADFLARCLCPRNLVVSASAVLWRRGALLAALSAVDPAAWLCAGDWRVYAEACAAGGRVHFVARPLNEHRRHDRSVTGAAPGARHFAEVVAMQVLLRQRLGANPDRDAGMHRHLHNLRRNWHLAPVPPAAAAVG